MERGGEGYEGCVGGRKEEGKGDPLHLSPFLSQTHSRLADLSPFPWYTPISEQLSPHILIFGI